MGELCGKVLTEICNTRREMSCNEVAKLCGIERTAFSKLKNGKRNLSYRNLEKIIKSLELSLEEEKKLKQAFSIENVGPDEYLKMELVENCICSLNSMYDEKISPSESKWKKIFEEVFEDEFPCIYAAIPFNNFIYKELKQVILQHPEKNIVLQHVFQINASSTENLSILREILYFLYQVENLDYKLYYIISDKVNTGVLYPYYILTGKHLLFLSANCESVLDITQEEVRAGFEAHFKWICKHQMMPFVRTQENVNQVISEYAAKEKMYFLFYQPCCTKYLTKEMIGKYLKPDAHKYYSIVEKHIKQLESQSKNIKVIFSKEGILNFAKIGILEEYNPYLVEPIDLEDRLFLLQKIKEDKNQLCIDKEELHLKKVTLTVVQGKYVIICSTGQLPGPTVKQIVIEDLGVIKAFEKYFEYFSFLGIEKEMTKNKIIDEAIEIVKEQIIKV
jgi:transcriptional regulator with XRE-family HTH domain